MYVEKKGIGINPISQIHYIDHLAVVCRIMDIPLLFIEPEALELGKRYYPELKTVFLDYQEFTPEYLIANYDVLFMSDLWGRKAFHEKYAALEKKYNKPLRHVHCPHGFSDKGYYLKKCADEDILLMYGQNMIDLLKHHDVFEQLNQYVMTGNYRYKFFQQNRAFYEQVMTTEVLPRFAKQQPIILYAPTWLDSEEATTFYDLHSQILGNLPAHYNMIVKLHPRLEFDDMAMYYSIVGKYENQPNVLFLKDFPLVYPLLAHTDIYLGDTSSVGYDFLAFNKPMFFLNKYKADPTTDRGLYLFRCGIEINPPDFSKLYQIIEKNLPSDERFSTMRAQTYTYTFGSEHSFEDIKHDIIAAYST